MLFISPHKTIFFTFFSNYNHVCPTYFQCHRKDDNQRLYSRTIIEESDLLKKSYYSMKHQEKMIYNRLQPTFRKLKHYGLKISFYKRPKNFR